MSELRRFEGYRPIVESPRELLPVGGYVAKIQAVKVEDLPSGSQRLTFRTEIAEGPYSGFFHKDYDSQRNSAFEVKYRGDYGIICPDKEGTDKKLLEWFGRTMGAIEDSNAGYHWNWDTRSLIGLTVGLSVREAVYRKNVYCEIGKFVPVSLVREGRVHPMERRVSDESETTPQPVPVVPTFTQPVVPPVSTPPVAPNTPPAPPTPALPFSYMADDDIPF